jgi:dolichol-phosphate mannosyltransferase
MSRAVIYVPVYQQAKQLPGVLREIAEAGLADVDFLLFDNGSTDGSGALIRESGHPWLGIPENRGVGYSYIQALDWALARDYVWFGAMAANGKMLPREVPRLLDPLRRDEADYVTGSRFLMPGHAPNLPTFRRATIPMVSVMARMLTGAKLTDVTNGFRAFRLDIMSRARFDWHAEWLHTYAFEYYLYAKVLLDPRLRAIEVPTTMRYPKTGRYSHIRPGTDWYAMLKPWVVARLDGEGFE